MSKWLRTGCHAAIFVFGIVLASTAVAAKWDMPVRSNQQNYFTQNIMQFADDIREATDGQIDIVIHPEDSLIKQPRVMRAIRIDQVPIGEWFMSIHSNDQEIFGVDSIPFLATSYKDNKKLLEAARPKLSSVLEERGIRLLFVVPWPPQSFYSQDKLSSVHDFQGVKFRAYNPITGRLAELMGATPVTVQQAEVSQAFSTGVIDAMITSPATGVDTQAWDFANYYTDVRAFIPWNIVAVNAQVFSDLDEDTQSAILRASEDAERRGWELAPEETDTLIETLGEHGMDIEEPTDQLMSELKDIGETLLDEWKEKATPDEREIVEQYLVDK